MHDPYLACIARGCSGGASFATCSADGTIRLWDLAIDPVSSLDDLTLAKNQNNLKTELVKTSCVGIPAIGKPRSCIFSCANYCA